MCLYVVTVVRRKVTLVEFVLDFRILSIMVSSTDFVKITKK